MGELLPSLLLSPFAAALLTLGPPAWAATLAVDVTVTTHQSTGGSSITSPPITTHQANELLVVFVTSDGPSGASGQSFTSVTGGGLTWSRRALSDLQPGTAEIWQAASPNVLTNVTVAATRAAGGYVGSITVVAFTGADAAAVGATSASSAATGAPTTTLTTKFANSWVWGVGNDWSRATARTVGANQTLVDQFLPSVGDTYWVQRQNSTTSTAGTPVTINDTAPTTDTYDLAAIEIVPASGTSAPPAPTNLVADVVNGNEVDLAWTAPTGWTYPIDHYVVTRNGANIASPVSTSYADTAVSGGATYTYTVAAVDSQGNASPGSSPADRDHARCGSGRRRPVVADHDLARGWRSTPRRRRPARS